MSMVWCLGACLEFVVWLLEREVFYLFVAAFAAVLTVTICRASLGFFWVNLGVCSVSLGVRLASASRFQVGHPAHHTDRVVRNRHYSRLDSPCTNFTRSGNGWIRGKEGGAR